MKKYIDIIFLLIFITIPLSSNAFAYEHFSIENRIIDEFGWYAEHDFGNKYQDTMRSVSYFVDTDGKYFCMESPNIGYIWVFHTFHKDDAQPCENLWVTLNHSGRLVSDIPRRLLCNDLDDTCTPKINIAENTSESSIVRENTGDTWTTKSASWISPQVSATCTLNGQAIDCSELKDKAKTFVKSGIYLFIGFWLIFLAGFIFWIFMLVHAFSNPIPDKVLWIAVIFFLSFIWAIIYYFVIKRRYQVVLVEKVVPTSISSEIWISNPIPASVQSLDTTSSPAATINNNTQSL